MILGVPILKHFRVYIGQYVHNILLQSSAEPSPDSDSDSNLSALSNMSGLSGEESWKPTSG